MQVINEIKNTACCILFCVKQFAHDTGKYFDSWSTLEKVRNVAFILNIGVFCGAHFLSYPLTPLVAVTCITAAMGGLLVATILAVFNSIFWNLILTKDEP